MIYLTECKMTKTSLKYLLKEPSYLEKLIPEFGDRLHFASYVTDKLSQVRNLP